MQEVHKKKGIQAGMKYTGTLNKAFEMGMSAPSKSNLALKIRNRACTLYNDALSREDFHATANDPKAKWLATGEARAFEKIIDYIDSIDIEYNATKKRAD